MISFISTFFLIAVAELGDKTQLLALSFASKYNPVKVMAGIFIGSLAVQLIAVLIGDRISMIIPPFYLQKLVGISFIVFGLWTLIADNDEEVTGKERMNRRLGPVLTVAAAFFLAEIGDKTQLAVISLAAEYRSFLSVWLGATLGMLAADAAAVMVGVFAHKHLPIKIIKLLSGAVFIIFGLIYIF